MFLSLTSPGVLESKEMSGATLGHSSKLSFPSLSLRFWSKRGNVVEASGLFGLYSFAVLQSVKAMMELYESSLRGVPKMRCSS